MDSRFCNLLNQRLAVLAHLGEAVAAINRTVALGLEGHAGLAAAGSAGGGEELPGAAGGVLANVAAGLAALGLVLEAALSIELLLTCCKNELFTAFLTNKGFVFVHFATSLEKNYFYPKRNCTAAKMLS